MRNLQKILALVLALVMSLSLMATAGARDFTDGDQIDETFAESVDVLTGLEVFQGYPSGDFQPKGDITRAEVAAIIYRIATGDVTDSQVGIYADYNKFSDVPSDNWAAGYINYCANAEYIKGRGDGKFYPQDKVTGYEALAMILRVVGYDKNGEFTGADWQVQTAATANQRKVTKNVNAGTLGNPATRETVAELLCQAILIEKVNYTLAFGYQISTDPKETIAYETFKMEKLEGVVTGNEVADLKESSPLSAGQTRLVIDGREEIVDIPTTLDKIGKSVRAYIRPQGGTTRKQLVTADVYDTELNHVYDKFAYVSDVDKFSDSESGISSVAGAEHFVNYDYLSRWTANIRITYVMDVQWTDYQAYTMLRDNGGRLFTYPVGGPRNPDVADPSKPGLTRPDEPWNTQLTTNATYTYTYTKTIELDKELTQADRDNLYSIFQKADKTSSTTGSWINGEVYVGTASYNVQKDISDEIRWTDFQNTYLRSETTKAQVESNGRGNRLIVIDNDDDGIAEYVLQTIYTIGKVASDGKHLDNINQKPGDGDNVNSTVASNTLVPVSGKDLAKSEDTLAAGDVVLYALIDGNIRAQKPETKTEKVNTVNRANRTITVTGENGATYNESAVHEHAEGLQSYVAHMAGNTTYTMFFDLDGNMAAFTEEIQNNLVLITNGWYNSTISGPQYAVQVYRDGQLQTVEVNSNGSYFVKGDGSVNQWDNLRTDFGKYGINDQNNGSKVQQVHTIVANLEGNVLMPVDKAYLYSQQLRVLDMKNNAVPGRDNTVTSWAIPYATSYTAPNPAYDAADDQDKGAVDGRYEVRAMSNTVYYTVYRGNGTDPMTRGNNVVVREYVGYSAMPNIDRTYIEDVYAVGAKAHAYDGKTYYTAQIVVIELNDKYTYSRTDSEQVFIPDFSEVTGNVGEWENVRVIRGATGAVETVKIDLNNSVFPETYDPAGGMISRARMPGLYYMDLRDSSSDVYVIEWMDASDIRANNYRAGYVNKSTVLALNDYVQVDMMAKADNNQESTWVQNFGSTSTNIPTIPDKDMVKLQSGKLVADSKLYNLSYNTRNVATLSDPVAVTTPYLVLGQTKQDGLGCIARNTLNERWDRTKVPGAPDEFALPTYNEVLVRCDAAGNIIWAVSFAEGTSATSVNFAQQVWYNCLPATTAATKLEFYGVSDDATNAGTPATSDLNTARNYITVSYDTADKCLKSGGKLLDLEGIRATISSYRMEKLNPATNQYENITGDDELLNHLDDSRDVDFRLTVTRNTGITEVYYLKQLKQVTTGELAHDPTQAASIRVLSNDAGYRYENPDAAKAAANKSNVWVNDPSRFDIRQLEEYLTFDGRKSVTVEYVENDAGEALVTKDKVITDAILFDGDGKQVDGKIVVKVVNSDGYEYFIQLNFSSNLSSSVEGAKVRAIADLDAFVKAQAEAKGLTEAEVKADPKISAGIDRIKALIDSKTTPEDVAKVFKTYATEADATTAAGAINGAATSASEWTCADGGKTLAAHYSLPVDTSWDFFGLTTNATGCIKSDLLKAMDDYKTAKASLATAKTTAKAAIDNANNAAGNPAAAQAVITEQKAAIDAATTTTAVDTAKKIAMNAIRSASAPAATQAGQSDVVAATPSGNAFNGIQTHLWYATLVQDATNRQVIKVSGVVRNPDDQIGSSDNVPGFGVGSDLVATAGRRGNAVGGSSYNTATKVAIIPIKVGTNDCQFILIGDNYVNYCKTTGNPWPVQLTDPTGTAFAYDLDLSGVTFQ